MSSNHYSSRRIWIIFVLLNLFIVPCFGQEENQEDVRREGFYLSLSYPAITSPIMFGLDKNLIDSYASPARKIAFSFSGAYEFLLTNPRRSVSIGVDYSYSMFNTFSLVGAHFPVSFISPGYMLATVDVGLHYLPLLDYPWDIYAIGMYGKVFESYSYSNPNVVDVTSFTGSDGPSKFTELFTRYGIGLGTRLFLSGDIFIKVEHKWLYSDGPGLHGSDWTWQTGHIDHIPVPTKLLSAGIGYHF